MVRFFSGITLIILISQTLVAQDESSGVAAIDDVAVKAVALAGPDSIASDGDIAGTGTLQGFRLAAGDGIVEIAWPGDPVPGVERYFLERSEDNQRFTIITEYSTGVPAYRFTDGAVENGRRYYYRLVTRGAGGTLRFYEALSALPGG